MRLRSYANCALLCTVVSVWPNPAQAQDAGGPQQPGTQAGPSIWGATFDLQCGDLPVIGTTDTIGRSEARNARGVECPRRISAAWFKAADRLILPVTDGLIAHGRVQFDTTTSHADFGRTWQASAEVTYNGPAGIAFTAGVVGRRGYEAPLIATEAGGGETIAMVTNSPMLDTTRRPVLWDTVLRVEKPLLVSRRVRMSAVVDAYNLVNINVSRTTKPLSETLTSRTVRLGLKVTF
jgi:hypothetical protein